MISVMIYDVLSMMWCKLSMNIEKQAIFRACITVCTVFGYLLSELTTADFGDTKGFKRSRREPVHKKC